MNIYKITRLTSTKSAGELDQAIVVAQDPPTARKLISIYCNRRKIAFEASDLHVENTGPASAVTDTASVLAADVFKSCDV